MCAIAAAAAAAPADQFVVHKAELMEISILNHFSFFLLQNINVAIYRRVDIRFHIFRIIIHSIEYASYASHPSRHV